MTDPLTETTALFRSLAPAEGETRSASCLVMIAGDDLGRRIDLPPGELTIGRASAKRASASRSRSVSRSGRLP